MASFQNLMDVVESSACDPVPEQDSNTGGCIMTRDYLSDGISCSKGKENSPPTPTPCKKRRLGPIEGCSVKIREADTFIPRSSFKEQEDAVCEHQSPSQPPSDDPAAQQAPPLFISSLPAAQQAPPLPISSFPSVKEMKPTGEDESTSTSVVKNKKQVRFGGPLSPELFDKDLPPSTPLQKGGTPARAPTPGESLLLRSVLKTPQRSESHTPQHRPELPSPTEFCASPALVTADKPRMMSEGADDEDGKMVFSPVQMDFTLSSDPVDVFDAQPLNLNSAFHEESLSQALTECVTGCSQTARMDVTGECKSEEKEPEADAGSPTPTQFNSKRNKIEQEPKTEPEARSSKRKRKLPEKSKPVQRSTRSAAKAACGKMKEAFSSARVWNKAVDWSLYGSREYASKNPNLSPISEKQSFTSQTPESCSGSNQETLISPRMTKDPAVTQVVENTSEDSVSSSRRGNKNKRKSSRSVGRKRGQRKRNISLTDSEEPEDQTGVKTEDRSSSNSELSGETSLNPSKSQQSDAESEEPAAHTSLDSPCSDRETTECPESPHASTPHCPPSSEEFSNTELLKSPTSCDVDENGLRDQAGSQCNHLQTQVGGAKKDLAPWQTDFNFEDVFEPVVRRRQSSVRRSLRNQSVPDLTGCSAGLAWLPHTSPDSIKETRRKSRRRRLSAALPVQPLLPEDNMSR